MGQLTPSLQQPSEWAKIRGCIVVIRREGKLIASWMPRPGAGPKPVSANEAAQHIQRGAWIVAALPASQHILRTVEAPFASMAKAGRVFESLLDLDLPFPLETCRTTFLASRIAPGGRVAALAAAAREEDVEKFLTELKAHDLLPMTMDMEGLALWDEWQRRDPEGFKLAASIFAVLEKDRLILLCSRGGSFADIGVYRRDLDAAGIASLATRIQRKLRSLSGFERWTWTWAGPSMGDTPWCQAFETEITNETEIPPFRTMSDGESILETALARRLLTKGEGRCNLLSEEEAHPTVQHTIRQRSWVAMVWMSIIGIVLLAISSFWLSRASWMTRKIQAQINQSFTALTGQPNLQPGAETLVAERMLTDATNRPFQKAFEPGAEQILQALLRTGLTQAAAFDHIQWSDGRLIARGTAPDSAAAGQIRGALEALGLRCQVRIGAELQPGRIAVEISAESDEGIP